MILEFNKLQLPAIADKLSGDQYEELKASLITLMLAQRLQTFDDESSADGPWPPLSSGAMSGRSQKLKSVSLERLKALSNKGFKPVKMLQDRGILRQSFTSDTGPGNSQREINTQGDEVSLISHVPYAAIQNFGGSIFHPGTQNGFGRGIEIRPYLITIPARPFDQFTEDNHKEINELMEHYING